MVKGRKRARGSVWPLLLPFYSAKCLAGRESQGPLGVAVSSGPGPRQGSCGPDLGSPQAAVPVVAGEGKG